MCLIGCYPYFFLMLAIFADKLIFILKKYDFCIFPLKIFLLVIAFIFTIAPVSLVLKINDFYSIIHTDIKNLKKTPKKLEFEKKI